MTPIIDGSGFREAVLAGLSARPRRIPCRFLYDTAGVALFERITALDSYPLCRAETALLDRHAADIAARVGAVATVIEPGAGTMVKTRRLLAALDPVAYAPIDVAGAVLQEAARSLAGEFPHLAIVPMVADFTAGLTLPPGLDRSGPVLVFFPGSTIGNLSPAAARDFLAGCGRLAGAGGWVLVGVDPVRDPRLLHRAYDDPQGVTAAFTRNLLARANRELGADFALGQFDHRAWWNAREGRMELHLVCTSTQQVTVAGCSFLFRSGDTIHVEDCYKYAPEHFHWLARQAGLSPAATWMDEDGLFSLHLLRPGAAPRLPS